jgi:lysozyme family protein
MRYGLKWPTYAEQWDKMKINPSRLHEFEQIAIHLVHLKDHYVPIERATGVPWYMIALTHMREANNDFSRGLAQGDRWDRVSVNKPICGPFKSFFDSAVWALRHDGLTSVHDWRLEKILWYEEAFNGLGPEMHGIPSGYIWGGTNIQRAGKYIHDGPSGWRPNVWDTQPGVAPILQQMAKIDPSIVFVRED